MIRLLSLLFMFSLMSCNSDNFSFSEGNISSGSNSCTYGDKVLIASNGGINITDEDFTDFSATLTTLDGLPSNIVYHLANQDDIIYASTHAGLAILGNNCSYDVIRTLTVADGLPTNIVTRTQWAPNGDLWIHTTGGIAISTDDGVTISSTITGATPGLTVTLDYGADHSYSTYVGWGPVSSTIFLGAQGGICRSVDSGASFVCSTLNAVTGSAWSNWVVGLAVLSNGHIFLATAFNYVKSIDDGVTWTAGVSGDWMNGLNHYVSSGTDILFFSPANLSNYSDDEAATFTNYGAGSGGAWNSFPLADGKVAIATVNPGMYVAQSEATITVTTPYIVADGLLDGRIRWVMSLE